MSQLPIRRFQRLYEQVLLSQWFSLLFGWAVVVVVPNALYIGFDEIRLLNRGQVTAFVVNTVLYIATYFSLRRMVFSFPGGRSTWMTLTHVFTVFALGIFVCLFFRIQVSRLILIGSAFLAMSWFAFEHLATKRYRRTKLAVLPGGFADDILRLGGVIDPRPLTELDLGARRYDGIVADFLEITAAEQRFLTQCALQGVPVYNAKEVFESVTGRVKINRMSENTIGALLPSVAVERLKLVFDITVVLLTLPLVLLISLVTMLCIRLESPGPVLFSQTRIGKGNRPFKIYKFRSMRFDQAASQKFAGENDPRITRVGRVIRKLRIDELPQFINILKGEMSLIGPRPEQPDFVERFDKEIPFYSYRHVVKPGISGWAQVRQGYADNSADTQVKIEHDFFYIKNYSIRLDIFIVFLTLRTMLTGFGAR